MPRSLSTPGLRPQDNSACRGPKPAPPPALCLPAWPPQDITGPLPRIGGIILAAGESSRMGRCKAILPLGGSTVLEQTALALAAAVTGPVVVVCGHHGDAVRAEARRCGLAAVTNPHPENGMFSSVQCGIQAIVSHVDAAFILPVDTPLVRASTCMLLAASFVRQGHAVTLPVASPHRSRTGHPPLLRADVLRSVLRHDGKDGLRAVIRAFADLGMNTTVPVADEGCLRDMDTPEAYRLAVAAFRRRHIPTAGEVLALLDIAATPPHVRAHGVRVGQAAALFACRMVSCASPSVESLPDAGLALASGTLHDILKGYRQHEKAGGAMLRRYGFDAAARIVAAHRDTDPARVRIPGERELVMLADKYIRGTTLIPMEERFDQRIREWNRDPQAVRDISARKHRAMTLRRLLDAALGQDSYRLLQQELA